MNLNKFLRDYLSFSRKDRIGILVLVSLLLLVFFLPSLMSLLTTRKRPISDESWIQAMKTLELPPRNESEKENDRHPTGKMVKKENGFDKKTGNPVVYFYFDPNTLPEKGWKRLGLQERTIRTIRRWLDKGGIFRQPADLQKIYGLKQDDYKRLSSYIIIDSPFNETVRDRPLLEKRKYNYPQRSRITAIDINSADTTAFMLFPGIGRVLASRIINFREKLGGFYSVEQVKETFGLQDSVFQKIKPWLLLETQSIRKINLNTATLEELNAHPYIKWNMAHAIIEYRNQHGNFTRLADVKKILVIDEETFDKLANYLRL